VQVTSVCSFVREGLACHASDAGGSWASVPWVPLCPGGAPVLGTGQPTGGVAAMQAAATPYTGRRHTARFVPGSGVL
jgi:hypothetical protein